MIFFSKEPVIELLHPTLAKVIIYLKITIVSLVTYELYGLLFYFYGVNL